MKETNKSTFDIENSSQINVWDKTCFKNFLQWWVTKPLN